MQHRKLYAVVALILVMVLGFLATSISSYFLARDSLTTQIAEQSLPLTSDNIYSEIQRDLLRPVLISSLMATDTFLRDWVMAGEQEPELIRAYLAEIQARYGTITAFFVSEETQRYYHSTGVLRTLDTTDPEDVWYARVREMRDPYEINVDHDTYDRSRLSIFINYRVLDYTGNYIGATGVGLAVSSVARLISDYQERYGRTIYFVDRQGNLTLTPGNTAAFEAARLQERPGLGGLATQVLSTPSTSLTYLDPDGHKIYLNSRLVPEFDWYLVVEQRENSAAGAIANTLWINMGLALGIMALVLFAAHYSLRAWQRQLEQMATTDRLTGVANRHKLETLFDHQVKRMAREKRPLSVVMLDVDHFKKINDTWGHQGGDQVLRAMAELAERHVRASDVVCRWGGEEFLLLLDNCDLMEAEARATTIVAAARDMQLPYGREFIQVTASCGVATYSKGDSLDSLVARADGALYQAKRDGRDRVCAAAFA
ncbi:MAG TPA: diguanylate cyclase [Hyphomicrobiales bacterium]|nr:diguanylate cyclase [Hyphomicrobiales bacterium]